MGRRTGKLAEFKKKRLKSKTKIAVENPNPSPTVGCSSLQNTDEDKTSCSVDNSNIESLNMKAESKVPSSDEISTDLAMDSSSQFSEGSDDAAHLVNADSELLSLFDQKIKRYQSAIQHKDAIIQKLSDRLASTMSAHAAHSESEEVKKLQNEINLLQVQIKEAAEMLQKQKCAIEAKTEGASIEETKALCEAGVQAEVSLSVLEELILGYSNVPNFSEWLSEFLKNNAAVINLNHILADLNPPPVNDDSANHKQPPSEVLENHQCTYPNDMPSLLKKMESLSIVVKLLESLANISSSRASIDGAGDFSCSKFQSYFLKRLNSGDGEPDASESESQLSDMNYVDVETPCVQSFNKTPSDISSVEKLRSQIAAGDFSIATDFLLSEMEKISTCIPCEKPRSQGDIMIDSLDSDVLPEVPSTVPESLQNDEKSSIDPDYEKFLAEKSKLETKLKLLKSFDKELQGTVQNNCPKFLDAETLVNSEDNILLEEPPMSCMSLLSLTDSEYRTENAMTDSETNFSRKVSFDMTRSMQDGEICLKCDKYFELMREKYDDHVCIFKEALENSLNLEKTEMLKKLESEIEKLKIDKENLMIETDKQIELLCQEQEMKIKHLSNEHDKEIAYFQQTLNNCNTEKLAQIKTLEEQLMESNTIVSKLKEEMCKKKNLEEQLDESNSKINTLLEENKKLLFQVKSLEEELVSSNKKINEIFEEKEILLQTIQNHQQELETLRSSQAEAIAQEQKRVESQYLSTLEVLKKLHEDEITDLKQLFNKQLQEKENDLQEEYTKTINLIETTHSNESADYQKKIEQLLEEKCELLSKTTQEYEGILKKNHKVLVMLVNHLHRQLGVQKERLVNESRKSVNSDIELTFSDALEELNRSIEDGILKFLNQNYFLSNEENFDDTEYLPVEIRLPITDNDLPMRKNGEKFHRDLQKYGVNAEKEISGSKSLTQLSDHAQSEGSLESEDILMIHSELNKLQEQFQKDAAMYEEINGQLLQECQGLRKQAEELEDNKKKLELQLQEKEKELAAKESQLAAIDASSVKGSISGPHLSSHDNRSLLDAARTNFRLLNVLSDLVKTFLDIERDINAHLEKHGLIPTRPASLTQHDEETGYSVGSREDFTSLSIGGECPTIELAEDGPDLTPRAWDLFATAGAYDADIEGEDVVLGASRRLRSAVDHLLNLLTRALDNQQNQDLKLLLKRNEELSQELQEEVEGRDALHMKVVTAESTIRKLECEKQRLEDLIQDLQENQEIMKRELTMERNKLARVSHEKESANDEIQMLKEQCEMLASRLGDPERTDAHKISKTSDNCLHDQPELLQENSRLSTEKQSVQKSLSQERQSFCDRLHQMEMELEGIRAEKEEIIEKKCREIRDLKAEMEAMEKQLQSNKKFIDEQAQEREQEREEYIREITKMQDIVREKEKIQSNEVQLMKEIEQLEQLLRARIEDHQNAMKKKEMVENDLRQSLDKIRDLRDVIEELEKNLDMKCKIEAELRQKLAMMTESVDIHKKMNSVLEDGMTKSKTALMNGESMEQVENLKEQLASQSQEIEQMSQNQTLLHELRGQIHFLEAKVEQRARLLESMHLSSFTSPIQSDDNSPSGSQGSDNLQLPCEDGYEMSPRSVHWLEIRRLEEKIGRLAHMDEELIKKNKELETQLRRMKTQQMESQHENAALQERLSEQLLQISALKSHIQEQKHCLTTPQKSQVINERIEELHEAFENQLEENKKLLSQLQETQRAFNALESEIEKKDNLIRTLQNTISSTNEQRHLDTKAKDLSSVTSDVNESTACFKLMLLEKNEELVSKTQELENLKKELESLQKNSQTSALSGQELETRIKIAEEFEKENVRLKSENEILKSEVESLNESLASVKEQLKSEQNQVETLMEELAHISQDNIEDVFSHKFSSYETCVKTLENAKVMLTRKLSERDNQLRERNSEISSLKNCIAILESSVRAARRELELEQVQVEQLLQEMGSLTGYQKRLEQDYDIIQEMMQQKERELATLHEETDAQMKLEAEVESLERELEEQKSIESELRQIMKQMEGALEVSKSTLKSEIAQWRLRVENLEKAHSGEVETLRKQIDVLCKNITGSEVEDIDITEIKKEILEAANTFGPDDKKAYGDLIYALLKKAVEAKLKKMSKDHEAHVKEINQSWENKIKSELGNSSYDFKSHFEKLEKENLLLREKFDEQNQRLSVEKDAQFDAKLQEKERILRQELEAKYDSEINNLKSSLENVLKEKSELKSKAKDLIRQIKEQKLKYQTQRNQMLKEFEDKIISAKKELQEKLESKQLTETICKQEIERLQTELHSKLEKERTIEESHREEISRLHKFFETRWVEEMKKIQEVQIEELKKLKDTKERNIEALCNHLFAQYSDRLKKLQEDYATQLAEERKTTILQHRSELKTLQQALERRFENEKKQILDIKEKEIKSLSESLERKYRKKLSELHKGSSKMNKDNKSRWEEERLELITIHDQEIAELKQELESKYEKMLQNSLMSHEAEIKSLEEAYSQKVEEVHELIREARRVAAKSCHSDSGSNRTATPSSEMSSDETCSSCQEDMLPGNKHILVNKIHQDGKRVLSLIESSLAPSSTEREARLWIEERKWIVKRIQILTPEIVDNPANLKLVISNLVDELFNARKKLIKYNDEVNKTQEKCSQLEEQLNAERSKVYIIATNLNQQTKVIKDLEALLNLRTSEVTELKKILANENSTHYQQNSLEKDGVLQHHSENLTPSSYDVGCLRSADEPRSADKFSMFLPEIESPNLQKSVEDIGVSREGLASLAQVSKELDLYLDRSISQESISQGSKNDVSSVREELMCIFGDKRHRGSYDAKLHGLYWVYKRSMSYNKSLVYQKKYLLMLLRGFQVTEKATLAWLHRMDNDISPRSQGDDSVVSSEPPLRGRSLFRSGALVIVAIQRMKFYVRRWRLLAKIPSSQVVDAEIRTVFQSYSAFSPTLTPGGCNLSSLSLSSKATSVSGHFSNSQSVTISRCENKTKEKYSTPDKRQLIEYVRRLETLQKQLGLDNFR
ncbi:pericentrin-like isoform X3 [Argiope bruennichi]|uniref:pericentrin-like isoform X3 n=1 Tax=Argiope bruennichi TaxID=94029 RepID=UPI0024953868|nr:pericentrin-like isoform X3 [Argiope bruennichi]